jgi:hypothetical protein
MSDPGGPAMPQCPSRIAPIVLELVQTGLTKARLWGLSNEPGRCVLELEHIHNLPTLLSDYSVRRLNDYWDGDRLAYLRHFARTDATGFEDTWETLGWLVADENGKAFTVKRRKK